MAFPLELNVLIKDPIYGYVALTDLERKIIETSVFQRLRFITQNGLAFYTYPALRGSRFEHSIGVCHLAGRVMTAALENSRDEVLRTLLSGFCESLEAVLSRETYLNLIAECKVDKNELGRMQKPELRELANFMVQLVRLLGLLHDIGHLPFSHLGEEALEPFERELLDQSDFDEFKARNCKLHEYIGYKIITEGIGGLREAFVNESDRFYFEAITGLYRHKNQLKGNSVLSSLFDLVDSDIDVDRGDYLRRDGYTSGIGFGHYDVDRLIESVRIEIVERKSGPTLLIAPTDASISPVEDFLLERYKLHKWLYYHHSIKYFNACLSKALESLLRLKTELAELHKEKFRLEYFHYTRYAYRDGFICNEVWLWDVFYKAFIDLKSLSDPTPEVKQAIVYLDVIINRAKRGFSLWKTHPNYLKFNQLLRAKICMPRVSPSAGTQYFRVLGKDLLEVREDQFFNTILRQLKNAAPKDVFKEFHDRFSKVGVEIPYGKVKNFFSAQLDDKEIVGRAFITVNRFEPFSESSLSTESEPVAKLEFLIRKPEGGKKVIRLTDVSHLIKSLHDVWKSDIQSYLFFIVSSTDLSALAEKSNRAPLEKVILDEFSQELCTWFEQDKLLTVES